MLLMEKLPADDSILQDCLSPDGCAIVISVTEVIMLDDF